jgi:hypothetical protein
MLAGEAATESTSTVPAAFKTSKLFGKLVAVPFPVLAIRPPVKD